MDFPKNKEPEATSGMQRRWTGLLHDNAQWIPGRQPGRWSSHEGQGIKLYDAPPYLRRDSPAR